MALLSATQGTPERLWATVQILAAHGGTLPRVDLQQWLRPRFEGIADATLEEKDRGLVNQALQAAAGLGLMETSRDRVDLVVSPPPSDIAAFADLVHGLLVAQPAQSADADILDAFACAVVETEILGNRQWLNEWTAGQIADLLTRSLTPKQTESSDQRFNTSRPATWLRWLEFVGLNETLSSRITLLSVTDRLRRALRLSDLPRNDEIAPGTFLGWLASAMPYLDGGRLFAAAAGRMGHVQGATLSRLLSAALRDLDEDEAVRLVAPRGDAQVVARLAADPLAAVPAFNAIILNGGTLDG